MEILGHHISIEMVEGYIKLEGGGLARGLWSPEQNRISIAVVEEQHEDLMNQTFWHELLHACLDRLGEEELSRNEKIIDLLGNTLYQAIRTAEF